MVIQIFFFKETARTGLESSCLLPCLLPTKPGVNGKKGFLYFLYFFNRMKFHTGIFSGLLIDMLVDLPPCAAGTTFICAGSGEHEQITELTRWYGVSFNKSGHSKHA